MKIHKIEKVEIINQFKSKYPVGKSRTAFN